MLDERERDELDVVLSYVTEAAGCEEGCYCGDDECTLESPVCGGRRLHAAKKQIEDFLTPKIRTLHTERLVNPAERIYFEEVRKWTERSPGINSGFSTLEHILNPDLSKRPPWPGQRDAEVVGTVIQWLGTNCGRCFIDTCERRIKQEQAERRAWLADTLWSQPFREKKSRWAARHARLLIEDLLPPGTKQTAVRRRLAYALEQMMVVIAFQAGKLTGDEAAKRLGLQNTTEFMKVFNRAVAAALEPQVPSEEAENEECTVGDLE